jgi:hypothetical protein
LADLAALRAFAIALPEVEERTWYVFRGKSFSLQSQGRTIMKLDRAHQELLFEIRPETFTPCKVATAHWSYVQIDHLDEEELRALVIEAWSTIAPKRLAAAVNRESTP